MSKQFQLNQGEGDSGKRGIAPRIPAMSTMQSPPWVLLTLCRDIWLLPVQLDQAEKSRTPPPRHYC